MIANDFKRKIGVTVFCEGMDFYFEEDEDMTTKEKVGGGSAPRVNVNRIEHAMKIALYKSLAGFAAVSLVVLLALDWMWVANTTPEHRAMMIVIVMMVFSVALFGIIAFLVARTKRTLASSTSDFEDEFELFEIRLDLLAMAAAVLLFSTIVVVMIGFIERLALNA